MTGSYMVILTAFLADNGKNLPLATGAHRRLLATVGSCAATGAGTSSWPHPAAGTADPLGLRDAWQRHRADQQLAPGLHPDGTL